MISRLQRYGVGRIMHSNQSLFQLSTCAVAAAAQPQPHFLLAHLQNLLGFSEEEAISAMEKVTQKSSRKDPAVVINFLEKDVGLDKVQIRSIVSADPTVLFHDVHKTLEPKLRVLQEIGFSLSDCKNVLLYNRFFFKRGVDSSIKFAIETLRKFLVSDEDVAKTLKIYPALFQGSKIRRLELNAEVLKNMGFSKEEIAKFIVKHPSRVLRNPDWLEGSQHKVENEFGISPKSKMFFHGVAVICGLKKDKIDAKFEIFRRYGCTDEQIYEMLRSYPYILGYSEDKIGATVNFFEGLGYSFEYLAHRPVLFGLSLDKRIRPRCEIFKVLKEKKLVKKMPQQITFLTFPESKFVRSYLLPFKDEIGNSYQLYIESIGRQKFHLAKIGAFGSCSKQFDLTKEWERKESFTSSIQ